MSYSSLHRFLIVALLSAFTALLSACGGGTDDTASTDAGNAQESTSRMLAETTVITGWTRCAVEYGTCSFTGTKTVRYGLGDKWATRTATGSIACNNSVFGDPYPGANKVCDVATTSTTSTTTSSPTTTTTTTTTAPTTSTTWTRCAVEYGTCSFTGTKTVRYGLGDKWATRTATGSIACNNSVFGDPYPGANKVCDVATTTSTTSTTETAPTTTTPTTTTPTTTTASWTRCATEYGTCSFSGTRTVRYGLGDKWATRTATGSIACNNSVFGDPYPGANKVCDYSSTTTTAPVTTTQIIEYYGDSTIYGYVSGSGGQVAKPAPTVFAESLPNPSAYIVRNEGVNSSTACDLVNGTDGRHKPWATQMAESKARYVIANHAINDEWKYDVATYQGCLRSLARTAKQYGKQMIFETPNPTRDSGSWGLDVYVNAMKQVATQEGVPVIDQYKYLTDYLNGQSAYTICPDGLHPTEAVYAMKGRYAASVFPALIK